MKPFDFWPEGGTFSVTGDNGETVNLPYLCLRSEEAEQNYSAMLRRLNAKLAVAWWKRKRPA